MADTLADILCVEPMGMVTVRCDLGSAGDAIADACGLAIPQRTRLVTEGYRCLGWMAPDELLLVLPRQDVVRTKVSLEDALSGHHALVVDVSDARVAFDVVGPHAGDVIAKLMPVDLDGMPLDGLRRSRAAQVAAALWRIPGGFRVIGYRSTADYLRLILQNAALPGSQLAPR